jgi:protein gp37
MTGISLVVAGGESGKIARRADISWVESLIHQCETQNVHLYWKSWGRYNQESKAKEKKAAVSLMTKNINHSRVISCLDRKIVFHWFRLQ